MPLGLLCAQIITLQSPGVWNSLATIVLSDLAISSQAWLMQVISRQNSAAVVGAGSVGQSPSVSHAWAHTPWESHRR
jgi:hypothetical protein